jgi:hypothetical protein
VDLEQWLEPLSPSHSFKPVRPFISPSRLALTYSGFRRYAYRCSAYFFSSPVSSQADSLHVFEDILQADLRHRRDQNGGQPPVARDADLFSLLGSADQFGKLLLGLEQPDSCALEPPNVPI